MDISAKKWDKKSAINGKGAEALKELFIAENGSPDRVLVFIGDALHAVEPAYRAPDEWADEYRRRLDTMEIETEPEEEDTDG